MADGLIQVPPDSTGKKVDQTQLTVGANTVQRQRMVIAGAGATDLAPVDATLGLSVQVTTVPGIGIPSYDYVGVASGSTTDTYTFKTGGSGGTTVATITVTWTDSTKTTVSSVVRT